MTDIDLKALGLSRWDNEGGAPASGDRSAVKWPQQDRANSPRMPEANVDRTERKIITDISKSEPVAAPALAILDLND